MLAKDCGNLPVPMNGFIIGNQTTYPNKLLFSCDDGFDLIGSRVRSCEADGKWSGEQPTCKGTLLIESQPQTKPATYTFASKLLNF